MREDNFIMNSNYDMQETTDEKSYYETLIEKLIDEYKDAIFNLLYRMTSNYDDSLDLMQETFINAYRSLPNFRKESSYKTWLFKIAYNLALRHKKKWKFWKFNKSINLTDLQSNCSNQEDSISNSQLYENIQIAISKLPADQKAIILLREIEELSYDEIAKIVNIPVGTVKSRLSRARSLLKTLLKIND
jgi:RNA polymerase sigma-70 factor (ECF subfamily)